MNSNFYYQIIGEKEYEIYKLQQRIDKVIEYTNSSEFFELMNSKVNTEYCPKDKSQGEDYFRAKEKLVSILQGDEEEDNE